MKQYLLGIDIGTSACKIAIFDGDGQVIASGNGDYPVYYPRRAGQSRIRKNGGQLFVVQCVRHWKKER